MADHSVKETARGDAPPTRYPASRAQVRLVAALVTVAGLGWVADPVANRTLTPSHRPY